MLHIIQARSPKYFDNTTPRSSLRIELGYTVEVSIYECKLLAKRERFSTRSKHS